ncbi:DUF3168 domain-containing protein [Sphaerisporangium sp. NPDC049003]|uniref:DUF3168 domain-containing protein n=1 Tax=Sphaerisporangium sp. NPDC049003 TaxID=3364517 RepID=UPI003713BE0E
MSAIWPVQQAIYGRLTADAELGALISGVFDEVPESKDKPYVAFAEITETPLDSHDRIGFEVMVTLNAWSAYRGFGQSAQVLEHVHRILHRVELEVQGWELISIAHVADGVRRVNDPNLRQGQARFRVWVQQNR